MCARWESKTSRLHGSTSDSQKLGLGTFLTGKKGSAMLLSWQHCISISPTKGWATGQRENTRCVNSALKKLVPLKLICVNALTLTALVFNIQKRLSSEPSKLYFFVFKNDTYWGYMISF